MSSVCTSVRKRRGSESLLCDSQSPGLFVAVGSCQGDSEALRQSGTLVDVSQLELL